jgi:hypothetical protein
VTRIGLLVLALMLAMAAGARADDLPVPPLPPRHAPPADTAPVPDRDASGPIPQPGDEPSFNVRLYRSKPFDPSAGFTPGSRYQSTEDRKAIQTPGISMSVPLQ